MPLDLGVTLLVGIFLCIFRLLWQKRIHFRGFEPRKPLNMLMGSSMMFLMITDYTYGYGWTDDCFFLFICNRLSFFVMRVITLISSARAMKTVRSRSQQERSASSAATRSVVKRECSAEVRNVSHFLLWPHLLLNLDDNWNWICLINVCSCCSL